MLLRKWGFLTIGVGLGGWLLWSIRLELAPFFLAFILAYLLDPLVGLGESFGLSRRWSIGVVYLAGGILLTGIGWLFLPELGQELARISAKVPGFLSQLAAGRRQMKDYLGGGLSVSLGKLEEGALAGARGFVGGMVLGLPLAILDALLVPVLAYYYLRDGRAFRRRFISWIPGGRRREVEILLGEIDVAWRSFLGGQGAVAGVITVLSGIFLHFLGVRYSLLLALVAGLGDLIPYFGPLLGSIPAVLLALEKSPESGMLVVGFFLVLHWLEETFLSPRLLGNKMGLHPLAIILALMVGGELGGIWGLFLAVPVAALVRPIGRFLLEFLDH